MHSLRQAAHLGPLVRSLWSTMIRLLPGDCRLILPTLPDASVQCVVTSPPYYGLRAYLPEGHEHKHREMGSEPTPEAFIAELVQVFREVRRVLRGDGTCFINLGDSYAGNNQTGWRPGNPEKNGGNSNRDGVGYVPGLAAKQLLLMPARVALALQADGWWVRSAITWAKPNPMPESVSDRPTSASEMVYLLAKGQWKSRVVKFADLPSECVHLLQDFGLRPAISTDTRPPMGRNYPPIIKHCIGLAAAIFNRAQRENEFSLPPFYSEVWQKGAGNLDSDYVRALPEEHRAAAYSARFLAAHATAKEFVAELNGSHIALPEGDDFLVGGAASITQALSPSVSRNREGTIAVHDAGEVCEFDFTHNQVILKSPTKCNYYYDADAVREGAEYGYSVKPHMFDRIGSAAFPPERTNGTGPDGNGGTRNLRNVWTIATSPYSAAHFATFPPELAERCIRAGSRPGDTILDPFSGAGTALLVADRLGRDSIGIDLNAGYVSLAKARVEMDAGLFANVVEAPSSPDRSPATPPLRDTSDITLLDWIERETLSSATEQCDAR